MATVDELTAAFRRAWPGAALSSSFDARIATACADVAQVSAELGVDAREMIEAVAKRSRGDADYVERCHPADLVVTLAAARGDRAAIERLERDHGATLRHAAHRFAGPSHGVEDLMQILRTKLFVSSEDRTPKIAEYDGRGSLATWLRVTAVRMFIDTTRRKDRKRESELPDDEPELLSASNLALDAIKAEYREAVAAALVEATQRLDRGDRHLLRQYLVEGLSIDQLGAALGIHRATAARRVNRARELLAVTTRELLTQRLAIGEDELEEIYGLVISKLDLSLARLLATPRDVPGQ